MREYGVSTVLYHISKSINVKVLYNNKYIFLTFIYTTKLTLHDYF